MNWENFQVLADYYPDYDLDLECETCGEVFSVNIVEGTNMVLISSHDEEFMPVCPKCGTWGI